ncbi:rod shape-determining protein MreD [Vagococcus carniphilus]|uniref:Rod shape-determining protein MreD n=1 Tax=Vagococcus carniphilus TaxID=218144 RepID=A0AAW8U556_9ENTE|nr:rod shape-determining protein MreD [Vagococcus carniphilus]MDT2813476.1 rod shape-determining protein MreD [Vagococcus carniphilus]MDT2830072.1 rod shape-determining protein MreD [Vagococcus carniphilus]MDT2833956.1 rod shape-determining protein MreD [Vagococcus carniphilus]MDT2838505.1 rod shape-determining protein MreD [Vagococcus carniphilus]MDT2848105.1 rod shape-determining protein MreD [Vagococcus carniphilus]
MMQKRKYFPYTLPIIFFLVMLVDGHISSSILGLFSVPMDFTSNLLLMFLMFATFQMEKPYLVIWSSLIGLLYDSYFYNVIGINLVLLPIIVLLMYGLFEHVIPSTFTIILSFIVFVTLLSVGRVFLLVLFKLTETTILDFFARTLAPTLLLNILLIAILVVPLKKMFNVKK